MTTTLTNSGRRYLSEQLGRVAKRIRPDEKVTLAEVVDGAPFRCEKCDMGAEVNQQYNLEKVDAITLEMPCGHSRTFYGPTGDETLPGVNYALGN